MSLALALQSLLCHCSVTYPGDPIPLTGLEPLQWRLGLGWLPRLGGLGGLVATEGNLCLTPAGHHGLWGGIHQDLGPVIAPFHIALAQKVQNAGEDISTGTGHAPSNSLAQASRGIRALLPGLKYLDRRGTGRPLLPGGVSLPEFSARPSYFLAV